MGRRTSNRRAELKSAARLPLVKHWIIDNSLAVIPTAPELQEKIMQLPTQISNKAELFEKRVGISYA